MALGWRQGKNEVAALAEEIKTLLSKGQSVNQIYNELVSTGKIRVGHTAFYQHVKTIQSVGEQSPAAGFVHSSSQSSRSQKSKQSVLPLAAPVARGVSACPVSDEGRKAPLDRRVDWDPNEPPPEW